MEAVLHLVVEFAPPNSTLAADVARGAAAARVRYHSASRATPLKRGAVRPTEGVVVQGTLCARTAWQAFYFVFFRDALEA